MAYVLLSLIYSSTYICSTYYNIPAFISSWFSYFFTDLPQIVTRHSVKVQQRSELLVLIPKYSFEIN